jgi:hypothetical protein
MIQTTGRNPGSMATGTGQSLDIIRMFTDALRHISGRRMWAPESHGRVGRSGDERRVILHQDDIVDPVAVGLHLRLEARRIGLLARGRGVCRCE